MSSVDPGHGRRVRSPYGYTFIEVMVVLALIGGMSLALNNTVLSTRSADDYLEALTLVSERGQRALFEVSGLVSEGRHVYQDDECGRAYLAACAFGDLPPAPEVQLPFH